MVVTFLAAFSPLVHAQLLGDDAPAFLWADSWSGRFHGQEVLEQDVSQEGVTFRQTATLTVRSDLAIYDVLNGRGFFETWQGETNNAHVTLGFKAEGQGGTVQAHVAMKPIEGAVGLDDEASKNGVSVDALKKTLTLAVDTCTIVRCDQLKPGHQLSVNAPNVHRTFGGTQPNKQQFAVVVRRPWPKDPRDVSGTYRSGPQSSGSVTKDVTFTYAIHPVYHVDAWAQTYRAGYLAARQSDLAPYKDYTPERCGPETLASTTCRAAYRERRTLKANADAATADFKRVVQALIDRTCPDFTRYLNLQEHRTKDIVIQGPIATYKLVQEVLVQSITSDPGVSYARLPDFMRCLYPSYDAYRKAVTMRQPGTTPIP